MESQERRFVRFHLWTDATLHCYKTNSRCGDCPAFTAIANLESKCFGSYAVELLLNKGIPITEKTYRNKKQKKSVFNGVEKLLKKIFADKELKIKYDFYQNQSNNDDCN